jgi:hypothetical protein
VSISFPGPEALGRSAVVKPGSPAPEGWDEADRVTIDTALLADPERLEAVVIDTQRRYVQRTPTVYELGLPAAELNRIEGIDTEPVELGGDGTISGNAGCNDYTGAYEVSGPYIAEPGFNEEKGQAFTVTDLTWTEIACEDDLVMEQETEYLGALLKVDHWAFGQGFSADLDSLLLISLARKRRHDGASLNERLNSPPTQDKSPWTRFLRATGLVSG